MTLSQTLKTLAVVALLSLGQIFFKTAAQQIKVGTFWQTLVGLALNVQLILALAIYGVATLLWVLLLREVPLSRAYPLTALGMVIVPAIGLFFFRESFSPSLLLGGALMIAGAYIIALR
jgi:undecaprenyl phosphate-alpha-L-ara4N flippase subunit ArnE